MYKYKVIERIEWNHEIQEEAGHVTIGITVYEADRIVSLEDWPADLVAQLLATGALEVVEDEPPKKGKK